MNLQQAYYEQRFENAFLRDKAATFQGFFEKLMGLAHKEDFMACRPWGNRGDRKNDGFLKSERRLFQVYAPNEMKEAKAISKLRADFEGAKEYWGKHFDKWTFVHNAVDGLPPHVHKVLLEFEEENPGITLDQWGLEELRVVFRRLTPEDMQSWLGDAPTEETMSRLGFRDLQPVLESIAALSPPSNRAVREVPRRKIEANALSEAVATLLTAAMAKTPLVEGFFKRWHDPTLGERIAESFREEYESLRESRTPNKVFFELQAWAGGVKRTSAEHELAVLAVLAYFFECCDIFEEPRSSEP